MALFEVTYSDGTVKTEYQHDCHTVDQMIQCRFGSPFPKNISVKLLEPVATEAPVAKFGKKKAAEK